MCKTIQTWFCHWTILGEAVDNCLYRNEEKK